MTLEDDRGLPLSTASVAARDAYVDGVGRLLCAQPGIEAALGRAIEADPRFALPHAALARAHQAHGRGAEARAAIAEAMTLSEGLGERERGHVLALERVVAGDAAGALAAIRAHLARHPRDRLVMAPCTGVFGLFGFSGRAGREAALEAFLAPFEPACGDDWWYLAMRAFARCETGALDAARRDIERSLADRPDNANGAHVRAHVDYECGEDAAGLAWLGDWVYGYSRDGIMHGHLHWHLTLAALALGDGARAWSLYEAQVRGAWGPPLNLVTDASSFLLRAEFCGMPAPEGAWRALAGVAAELYPQTGVAFADAHVALAFAMAGDEAGVARVRDTARGPAADVVAGLARAFDAYARRDDRAVLEHLLPLLPEHERIGGSRAQRDLLEQLAVVAQRRGAVAGGWRPRVGRAMPPGIAQG
jgi:tetratricopeptide (TPR) repeat protein